MRSIAIPIASAGPASSGVTSHGPHGALPSNALPGIHCGVWIMLWPVAPIAYDDATSFQRKTLTVEAKTAMSAIAKASSTLRTASELTLAESRRASQRSAELTERLAQLELRVNEASQECARADRGEAVLLTEAAEANRHLEAAQAAADAAAGARDDTAADLSRWQARAEALALALDHLGIVTFYRSEEATAIALLREALEISSTASLNDAERSVVTHNKSGLAFALINTGKLDEGEKVVNEAIAEYRQMPGPHRWEMGGTLLFRSVAAVKRNQLDQAEADLLEGEGILRRTLGDSNTYLGWNLNQQAALSLLRNDVERAERLARDALGMFQSV